LSQKQASKKELKTAAEDYYLKGFIVFTIKGKQPLAKWENWQARALLQRTANLKNFKRP
jgi:hypothetical protein